jgi:rubrerythrin
MSLTTPPTASPKLIRQLILDELFDLSLYRKLERHASPETAALLRKLAEIETGHLAFWQNFFKSDLRTLGPLRHLKLSAFVLFARAFGEAGIHLVLEAIEVNGIRKYLTIWEIYQDQPLGAAVKNVLTDELKHEGEIVSASSASGTYSLG